MPDTIDNIIVPEGPPTGRRAFMPDILSKSNIKYQKSKTQTKYVKTI